MGSCVYVRGIVARSLDDGKIVVRVDDRIYQGTPVASQAAA